MKTIWMWLWRNWISDYKRVVKITGWRSAIVDTTCGQRQRVTFMPWRTWLNNREHRKIMGLNARKARWSKVDSLDH